MYKHGRQYVDLLLYVAYNIVYLVLCTLPSHTKTLLESAAQDYKGYVAVQQSIHTNVADKSVLVLLQTHWTQCVADVSAKVLHKDCIVSYVALLVDSLQKKQADEKSEEKGKVHHFPLLIASLFIKTNVFFMSDAGSGGNSELLSLLQKHDLSLQCAVLFQFAEKSQLDEAQLEKAMFSPLASKQAKEAQQRQHQQAGGEDEHTLLI